jgi:hypothetical protein
VIVELPAATPVTSPELFTVAVEVLLLAHVPPASALLNVDTAPWQALSVPLITAGKAFTVKFTVLRQPLLPV